MASPAARLSGFLILLAIMFACAFAVGARLGPVTLAHQHGHGSTQMDMGSGRPTPAQDRTATQATATAARATATRATATHNNPAHNNPTHNYATAQASGR